MLEKQGQLLQTVSGRAIYGEWVIHSGGVHTPFPVGTMFGLWVILCKLVVLSLGGGVSLYIWQKCIRWGLGRWCLVAQGHEGFVIVEKQGRLTNLQFMCMGAIFWYSTSQTTSFKIHLVGILMVCYPSMHYSVVHNTHHHTLKKCRNL